MIENSRIEEIREKADIVEVISGYTALKKKGKNYLALCPFHSEKTPSFTVSQEKQLFHCFGCGQGGNVFTFLMKIENLSFAEAVKLAADRVGIEFTLDAASAGKQFRQDNRALYAALDKAADFFQANMEKDEAANKYAAERGLTQKILDFFRIGSAPDSWDSIYKHLTQASFSVSDIEKAGLIIRKEDGSSYYDRFRKRLMFPIWDIQGRVIGFGARSLDGSSPKYINSPESPVYSKGSVVYGLNFSKDRIKEEKRVYLVEGYMDFIRCYAHGIKNIAASSGTSLTPLQIKALGRLAEEFVLVFDSDEAGAEASRRTIDLMRDMDLYPKVVTLAGGKDPDELIRKEGAEKFGELLRAAVPATRYRIDSAVRAHNIKEAEGKARAAKKCAAILSQEKNQIIRDEYIKYASQRLGINSDSLLAEIKRVSFYGGRSSKSSAPLKRPGSKVLKAERALIKLWMEVPAIRADLEGSVLAQEFSDPAAKKIFELLLTLKGLEEEKPYSSVTDMLNGEEEKKLLSQIALDRHEIVDYSAMLKDCSCVLKANSIKADIEELRQQMKEAEEAKDTEKLNSLQAQYLEHHGRLMSL